MSERTGHKMIFCAASAGLLLLAGCGGGTQEANLAQLDNQIAAADVDPALTSALQDDILVDPALVQQSNANAVRQPERPLTAQYPITRAGAGGQGASAANPEAPIAGACGVPIQYGREWAERLPAEFPAYPGGRVTEAAGVNHGNCRMRVVTFTTGHNWQQVIGWYRDVAGRAGFDAGHPARGGDQILAGVNRRTDGAYFVIVTPAQGGSEVALIVNNGR
ncbi:MAG TPA: hypothetical protein VGC46_13585 [Allosphingosinicella sp.]